MVVVSCAPSPFSSHVFASFLPNLLRISDLMVVFRGIMVASAGAYAAGQPVHNLSSRLPWININMLLAVAVKLVQRNMLAQASVNIYLRRMTLLHNL